MKSVKLITLGLLFAMFTGCNKEEKEPPALRLVSRIEIYQSSSGSIESDQTLEYRYDEQNRIKEIITADEYGSPIRVIYTYTAENIMVANSYTSNTYTLNNNGFITSLYEDDRLLGTMMYSSGYLQKTEFYMELFSMPVTISETLTWENGNIKTSTTVTSFSADPPLVISVTTNYEYSSLQNKPSSMDFGRSYTGVPSGWYGKSTMNLPMKTTLKREDGSEDVTTCRYETDADGYPIKIFVQGNGYNEELRTVIEYED